MSQPCGAILFDSEGREVQCHNQTLHGWLCAVHAKKLLGLRVAESTIENAGNGLFATRQFKPFSYIDEYVASRIVSKAVFDRTPSDYGVQLRDGRVLDSQNASDSLARYANDLRVPELNNAMLVTEYRYGREFARPKYSFGSKSRVFLIAGENAILKDQEITCTYGEQSYWEQ